MLLLAELLAIGVIVCPTLAQQFIVPPDLAESGVPDESLSYAFGQTMEAQWWTDWQTVTLKLETCEQNTTFTLFSSQPNRNAYTFTLTTHLVGRCPGYSLSITADTDAAGYPAQGLVINSQHFQILNVTKPSSIVGAFTEPITTGTGSSVATYTLETTIFASTGTVGGSGGVGSILSSPTGEQATGSAATTSMAVGGSPSNLKIGLGIGIGLGIPVAFAVILGWVCFRRKSRRQNHSIAATGPHEDSHEVAIVPPTPQLQKSDPAPNELMNQERLVPVELKDSERKPELHGSQPQHIYSSSDKTTPELGGEVGLERHELAAHNSLHGD